MKQISGFWQTRKDNQERGCSQRRVDGRRMEEKIREGKGEKLKAEDQDGKTGRRIEKVRTLTMRRRLIGSWIIGSIG
jgi:hypothetical protein